MEMHALLVMNGQAIEKGIYYIRLAPADPAPKVQALYEFSLPAQRRKEFPDQASRLDSLCLGETMVEILKAFNRHFLRDVRLKAARCPGGPVPFKG